MTVPNEHPSRPSARRIAIIGEAPGTTEVREGRPFVGPSGFRLDRTLQEVGLSREQCFVGNVCVEQNTPVLMADLTWKPIKDVEVGDVLMAFDEHGKTRGSLLRKWRYSIVTAKQVSQRHCWKMRSEFGDLVITSDHRVLSMPENRSSSSRWSRVESLWVGRSNFAMAFKRDELSAEWEWLRGYLAGLFDGEGTLTVNSAPKGKRSLMASFSQNEGLVLKEGIGALQCFDFATGLSKVAAADRAHRVCIKGGVSETMRFLSLVRPHRLLDKLSRLMADPPVFRPRPSRICERDKNYGVQTVVDLTTTTSTFIANGFAVHNCQIQPPANEIKAFKWTGPEIQDGLAQLRADLATFQPHFCLLLGGTPLKAFKGDQKASISDWRGSLFVASDIAPGVKCMATWHPAATLRDDSLGPVMRFDIARAAKEAQTDVLGIPTRHIEVINHSNLPMLFSLFQAWKTNRSTVSADIEGGVSDVSCIGFAISPFEAVVVPFTRKDGSSVWTEDEEVLLWTAIRDLLEDPLVPKILQNYLYDAFVLAWTHGILIRGLRDDTMLKHFELFCELEKSLGFQASLYTKQPFYKGDRKSNDDETFYRYCGMDCCVTYECSIAQDKKLSPAQRKHYEFNLNLLPACLYMELRGIRYDPEKARRVLKRVLRWQYVLQDMLNTAGGKPFPTTETDLLALVREKLCSKVARRHVLETKTRTFKNGKTKTTVKKISQRVEIATWEDCIEFVKDSCGDVLNETLKLVRLKRPLYPSERGRLSILLDSRLKTGATGRNRKSNEEKDANKLLYETWGFPKQTNKEGNLTSRSEALLAVLMKLPKDDKVGRSRAKAFLLLRSLQTQATALRARADDDGRIRTGLNLVGTETDRFSAYESPTGSGYNLQTVTKKHRHLFTADPGCLMIQSDLRGADGWTIAANAARQGDHTMIEDCRAGIKPAKVIALLHTDGPEINKLDRAALKERCKTVDSEGWLYAASKAVYYGSSYGMQPRKMSETLLDDSFKKEGTPILVPPEICRQLQERGYFLRYPGVRRWQEACLRRLKQDGVLSCSNGYTRRFFGRKDDAKTHRDFLATEPQVMTTWATKLALWRLWTDIENRLSDGSLRIEPLLTVHDSLIKQARIEDRAWAAERVPEWFNNAVVIAGLPIVIPPDMGCGPNWKETTEPL